MYIRRKVFSLLQDENGEERYFSTTEFINYDLELEQREFGKKQKNARAIARANQGAEAAANKAAKERARIEAGIKAVNEAGGINKVTNKEMINWLQDKKYRNAVESGLNGGQIQSEKINQIAKGAEANSEIAADKIAARGKTVSSVRSEGGNSFKAGGRDINVRADNSGQTLTTSKTGPHNQQETKVVSKANRRRSNVVQNANQKEREILVNERVKGRRRGKVRKITTNRGQGINFEGGNKNATTIVSETPNQYVNVNTSKLPEGRTVNIDSVYTKPKGQPRPNSKPKTTTALVPVSKPELPVKLPKPTTINESSNVVNKGKEKFLKTRRGKILLGAAALTTAAGTGYGIYKHNKNKKQAATSEAE
jgi:hypothetical protein